MTATTTAVTIRQRTGPGDDSMMEDTSRQSHASLSDSAMSRRSRLNSRSDCGGGDMDLSRQSNFTSGSVRSRRRSSFLGTRSEALVEMVAEKRRAGRDSSGFILVSSKNFIAEHWAEDDAHHADFQAHYEIRDFISKGRYGDNSVVYSCYHAVSESERAVKIVKKKSSSKEAADDFHNLHTQELTILKNLDHPNILKMYEMFEQNDNRVYIVTDLYKGGTLKADIDAFGRCNSEETGALMLMQVLSCANYCHGKGIVHCDLNPENILLEQDKLWDQIRVIDFGQSAHISKKNENNNNTQDELLLRQPRGTKPYMAPEVCDPEQSLSPKSDIWSIGILAYFIFSEHSPFEGIATMEEAHELIRDGVSLFEDHNYDDYWIDISEECKDFIQHLLTFDSSLRPTAEQALKHPWIENVRQASSDHLKMRDYGKSALLVLDNVLRFRRYKSLQQAICNYIASQLLTKEEKHASDEVFRAMDTDCDGKLSWEEVKMGFIKFYNSRGLTDRQLHKLFHQVDTTRTGFIEYSDFIVASTVEKELLSERNLRNAFDAFDIEGTGFLSNTSIKRVLQSFKSVGDIVSNKYSNEEEKFVKELINRVGTDGKSIQFDDFCKMFTNRAKEESPVFQDIDNLPKTQKGSRIRRSEIDDSSHFLNDGSALDKDTCHSITSSLKLSARHFVGLREGEITDTYNIGKFVNSGAYGSIYMSTHLPSGCERAVKILKKSESPEAEIEDEVVYNEISILKDIDHPNILRLYETFADDRHFYMVMDLCKGGDLCDQLDAFGRLGEVEAAILMNQLLACVNYLHKQHVLHRDLKPENILLEQNHQMSQIKLIDFGFSRYAPDEEQRFSDRKGTVEYMAPEVLKKAYGCKCDIWSCGMIAYVLMTDDFPFRGETQEAKIDCITNGDFEFELSPVWSHLSEEAKDFIQYLLNVNEATRPTAEQALEHPWLEEIHQAYLEEYKQSECSSAMSALNNMKNFNTNHSELRKATYMLMASQLITKQDREEIDELFRAMDRRHDGRLSKDDVKAGYLEYFGEEILNEDEIDGLFQRVDLSQSGFIDYSEFVIATMNEQDLLYTDNKLENAFDLMDRGGKGTISVSDLEQLLSCKQADDDDSTEVSLDELEAATTTAALEEIIGEAGGTKEGEMTYDEFIRTMRMSRRVGQFNNSANASQADSCLTQ